MDLCIRFSNWQLLLLEDAVFFLLSESVILLIIVATLCSSATLQATLNYNTLQNLNGFLVNHQKIYRCTPVIKRDSFLNYPFFIAKVHLR